MSTPVDNISTVKSTYNDPEKGIVNGVRVTFRMLAYDERGEVQVPVMDAAKIKAAIDKYVSERDKLAGK